MSLTADMVLAPASNASCRPSRYVSSRSLSFDCLCVVGGANVACNVFVTVGDTLLLLDVLHEYVDADLAGGSEEVPRLPERFVKCLANLGVLVTDFAGRNALE